MTDDKKNVLFEDMPNLPDRLRNFEQWLEHEPCTHPANAELEKRLGRPLGEFEHGCTVISNLRMMCPSCRLRMAFYHTIYYADNYSDEAIAASAKKQGITSEQMKKWLPFAPGKK